MTLLSIIKDAAKEAGFAQPSRAIGSTDETAVRLLRAVTRSGRVMLRRHAWEALSKEYSLTTDGNADGAYALPSDYQRFVNGTWWDRTNQWPLGGPVNAQEWGRLTNGVTTVGPRALFRLRGGEMLLYPVPSSGVLIKFEYIKKNWIVKADGTEVDEFAADTDTVLFDEELLIMDAVWRFRKAQGLDYSEEKAEADKEIAKAMGQSGGAKVLNLSGTSITDGFGVNVPEGNWSL